MNNKFRFTIYMTVAVLLLGFYLILPKASSSKPSFLGLEKAFTHLQFEQPLALVHSPDGTNRLFVIEQKGIIRVFPNDPDAKEAQVFLDWTEHVRTGHSEEGMLGMAFHPDYKSNGYLYVDYIADNPRRTVVSRFTVDPNDPNRADPESEWVILEVNQPYGNHNGGQLAFGPDGYLYIALGDGGSGGDPHGYGQDKTALLGKILRIDADVSTVDSHYGIPADNPFKGNTEGYRQEIYAYGLRNPWRFSFDSETGKLWAADVGQDKPYEEIDLIEKGKNYGWNTMEGFHCFKPQEGCSQEGLTLPIWEYSVESGRSVTGGYVYRGTKLPILKGRYVYGDFVSGRVWALDIQPDGRARNQLMVHESNLYPSSFGLDEKGELYICSFDRSIYHFVSTQ